MSEIRRVNRLLTGLHTTLCIVLILGYLVEVMKGARTIPYYIVFSIILIIPAIINYFFLSRNKETNKTKYVVSIGFLILYAFVLATTTTVMAFCYMLPNNSGNDADT